MGSIQTQQDLSDCICTEQQQNDGSVWLLCLPSSHHQHTRALKPFHILPGFAAITHRWAAVICHTLQSQQHSQDEWLRSLVVVNSRLCHLLTKNVNRATQICSVSAPCWNSVSGVMAIFSTMNYLAATFEPSDRIFCHVLLLLFYLWKTDVPAFFKQAAKHVFLMYLCPRVWHSALHTALTSPT